MYKKDKICLSFVFIFTFLVFYLLKIDVSSILESTLTVISILLGFYITAISTLYGRKFINQMSKRIDKKIKTKTELMVLMNYFTASGIIAIMTIILTFIAILVYSHYSFIQTILGKFSPYIINIIPSTIFPMIIMSIYLMFRLFKLFINGVRDETKIQ